MSGGVEPAVARAADARHTPQSVLHRIWTAIAAPHFQIGNSPGGQDAGAGQIRHAYRPDIDGLRAVAVLSVLGYHLQISFFSGGFVGVDIFFVISGYLIGSHIISECRQGRFSLARFYVRRIRRIVPAVAAMMLAVLAVSYFLLFPSEFENLAYSALYAALSVSNIYFLNHSGYFDTAAATQPLLHTWSLAVEEQFYVVFPLLVLAIYRFAPRRLNISIAAILLLSLGMGCYETYSAPDAAFYLAPPRAWELLLGTIVAVRPNIGRSSPWMREVAAVVGLLMLAFAIFFYDFETPFPGAAALLPCLGAALIIASGQEGPSLVARGLSLKPVVFIGMISYSLYLWHWPIIFFQQLDSLIIVGASRKVTHVVLIGVCLLAAIASWRFIEQPFRRPAKRATTTPVFAGGLLALASISALAIVIIAGKGYPDRFKPQAVAYAAYAESGAAHFRPGKCFIVAPYTFADYDRRDCLNTTGGKPNYLLIGDSHAAQLWFGLSTLMPSVNLSQATAAGCLPVFHQRARVASSCPELMGYVFDHYLLETHVDRLLVAARWNVKDLPALEEVLRWTKAHSIPVTLIGPIVEYDMALPRVLALASQDDDPTLVARYTVPNDATLDDTLRKMAIQYNARYVSLYDLLCTGKQCVDLASDGAPLQFDTDHLSRQGSLYVAGRLKKQGLLF